MPHGEVPPDASSLQMPQEMGEWPLTAAPKPKPTRAMGWGLHCPTSPHSRWEHPELQHPHFPSKQQWCIHPRAGFLLGQWDTCPEVRVLWTPALFSTSCVTSAKWPHLSLQATVSLHVSRENTAHASPDYQEGLRENQESAPWTTGDLCK